MAADGSVLQVEQVDLRHQPSLRRWWETGRDCWSGDRVVPDWPVWDVSRRVLPADNPELETSSFLASDQEGVVGFGMLVLPVRDNPHLAFVDLGVLPGRRREGRGTALAGVLEELARKRGRNTVIVEGYAPPEAAAPCEPFAATLGYELANQETVKHQSVASYRALRDDLRAETAAGLADYQIVGWDTGCPDEYIEDCCRLLSGFNAQVPLGDLALEDSEWTPERMRAWEARNQEVGRHSFSAGAVSADGSLVGTSGIRVDDDDPTRGTVGITLVAPDHRGHRLGLALKMAVTDLALQHFPDLDHVETSNADSNTHMNGVNERLGYRPVERLLEFQKVL
ncbi:GNAT family N-acetyltransferase [Nocardioides sp.]|uniref:GNAT family N-acetyltransferase n=1 Tax=Nocardioides sp. TaxID=35761 RepID=UPI002ED43846